jgi:uncharacterized protein YciW
VGPLVILEAGMWALYLDESGSVDRHSLPLDQGQTPVFVIGGVALPLSQWRGYDRDFLNLKRQFFAKEIEESSKPDTRFEVKGSNLIAPRNATSERNRVFSYKVYDLIEKFGGKIFGCAVLKCSKNPVPKTSLYTKAIQIIDERFDVFLREINSEGLIVLDSRMAHMKKGSGTDYTVAVSHLSYVFGNNAGRELKRIKEAPLFADSALTVGLQIADIVAAHVYAKHYREKLAPNGQDTACGYLDYTASRVFDNSLKQNIFQSTNTYSQRRMYGVRLLDHRASASTSELSLLAEKFKK